MPIVNDVTRLNPVPVFAIATPSTIDEVRDAVTRTTGPISVGGGHFSMGGQTASPDSLHLDMRRMNQVLWFSPVERTIRVQAGIRWCDIQRFVDPHGLAVKIMQTYANFTVGGSLSVNVHGRYVGHGPLVLSVRAITLVLMSGDVVHASRSENAELFWGASAATAGWASSSRRSSTSP
jgi:FAD/FMN-containing dehydrogenase